MKTTKIEWTDNTWNPITGCSKISAGCQNCYAERMAYRLQSMRQTKYKNGFNLTLHYDALKEPLGWKSPHSIFVCSMSDLFHKDIPTNFVDQVMEIIKQTPRHRYQLLTKRADRMADYFKDRDIPRNVWLGVTVENCSAKSRIDFLRTLDATIRFISCEPLLEDLGALNLTNIDWVIVGGESGPNGRQMRKEWVLSIQKQTAGSAFFFKQWGTWGDDQIKRDKYRNGKLINGIAYQAMPQDYVNLFTENSFYE
ncbi:MAG: phage Gp37/Gp68 family protein [Helicobacteraceae bacterium]|jgi:protein gp37|nr:phage Gp37/Gp68 family protein [Helicobacteraceae bacterium]